MKHLKTALAIFLLISLSLSARTQTPQDPDIQMIFGGEVNADIHAELMVTEPVAKKEAVQKVFNQALLQARKIFTQLNPKNPESETAKLLSQPAKGVFNVSPDLAKILATAQEIAKKLKEPLAKNIRVDLKANKVEFQSGDINIDINPFLKGYLADQIAAELGKAGYENIFLNVEGIYIAKGKDFNGPWKIPVMDNTTQNAQHAFLYKAINISAATINWEHEGDQLTKSDLKSVTVFSEEGALKAQGLAAAVYTLGLEGAKKFLKQAGVSRAVLINSEGKFIQISKN